MNRIAIAAIVVVATIAISACQARAAPGGLMGLVTPPATQTEADQHFVLM